jgi:hypothetical protein
MPRIRIRAASVKPKQVIAISAYDRLRKYRIPSQLAFVYPGDGKFRGFPELEAWPGNGKFRGYFGPRIKIPE